MHKRKKRNLFCCLLVSTSMLLNGCATYYTRFSENPLLMGGAFVFDVVTLPVQIVFLSTMALKNAITDNYADQNTYCTVQGKTFNKSDYKELPLECEYGFIPNSEGFIQPIKKENLTKHEINNPVLNSFADYNGDIFDRIRYGDLESITINYNIASNCNHIDNNKYPKEFKSCLAYFNPFKRLDKMLAYTSLRDFNIKIYIGNNVTSLAYMFAYTYHIFKVPLFDLNNVTDMSNMFKYSKIDNIPEYNTENVTNMRGMFAHAYVDTIPNFNTKNVTDMSGMFAYSHIETIPNLDTQNVLNMESMFEYTSYIKTIPPLNTKNVTNMKRMFAYSDIYGVPLLNTANVQDMSEMFENTRHIETIPLFNTQNVTTMERMFKWSRIKRIPKLNTQNVINMDNMFDNSWIEEFPELNTKNVKSMHKMFVGTRFYNMTELNTNECSTKVQ